MKNPLNYLAVLAILLWLAWMNYESRHPIVSDSIVLSYEKAIDSLKNEMTHLEARRDTIIEQVVSVQVRWRERLLEVRNSGKIDTIRVAVTMPMELDSCKEVGIALMQQIEVTEIMLDVQRDIAEKAMIRGDYFKDIVMQKERDIAQSKRRGRIMHSAAGLLTIGVIVLAL